MRQGLRDFLLKCFTKNPSDRPTAAQLLEHQFVKKSVKDHKTRTDGRASTGALTCLLRLRRRRIHTHRHSVRSRSCWFSALALFLLLLPFYLGVSLRLLNADQHANLAGDNTDAALTSSSMMVTASASLQDKERMALAEQFNSVDSSAPGEVEIRLLKMSAGGVKEKAIGFVDTCPTDTIASLRTLIRHELDHVPVNFVFLYNFAMSTITKQHNLPAAVVRPAAEAKQHVQHVLSANVIRVTLPPNEDEDSSVTDEATTPTRTTSKSSKPVLRRPNTAPMGRLAQVLARGPPPPDKAEQQRPGAGSSSSGASAGADKADKGDAVPNSARATSTAKVGVGGLGARPVTARPTLSFRKPGTVGTSPSTGPRKVPSTGGKDIPSPVRPPTAGAKDPSPVRPPTAGASPTKASLKRAEAVAVTKAAEARRQKEAELLAARQQSKTKLGALKQSVGESAAARADGGPAAQSPATARRPAQHIKGSASNGSEISAGSAGSHGSGAATARGAVSSKTFPPKGAAAAPSVTARAAASRPVKSNPPTVRSGELKSSLSRGAMAAGDIPPPPPPPPSHGTPVQQGRKAA